MSREDRNDVRARTSRALAYILRHGGPAVGLTFDDDGYATLDDVLKALYVLGRIHNGLTREVLLATIDDPANPRFERQGERVRARYGHSAPRPVVNEAGEQSESGATDEVPQARPAERPAPRLVAPPPPAPVRPPEQPPVELYHGTSKRAAEQILSGMGLQPRGRQYVHLSTDIEEALRVGLRHGPSPVILRVDAQAAAALSVVFSHAGERTWLASPIPAQFLTKVETPPTPPPGPRDAPRPKAPGARPAPSPQPRLQPPGSRSVGQRQPGRTPRRSPRDR